MRDHPLILVWFLFAAVSLVGLPGAAHAQAGKVYRIGFLREGPPPQSFVEAFRQGLREQGYAPDQNVVIEFRNGSLDQLPQLAEELVRLKVDVIVASAGSAALAAKKATATVPIVFATVNYPVEIGLVASLSRPGGNVSGTSFNVAELAGKRLALLKELVPTVRRVAVLSYPPYHTNARQLTEAEAAAHLLGLQLEPISVTGQCHVLGCSPTPRALERRVFAAGRGGRAGISRGRGPQVRPREIPGGSCGAHARRRVLTAGDRGPSCGASCGRAARPSRRR
jgi:ABC-type uncharacterized transport system substrate-binding protein